MCGAISPPAHPRGALALELDCFHQSVRLEPKVRPLEHRLEKSARRGPAPPMLLIDVKDARALVVPGVEIGDRFDPGLRGGGAERIQNVPAHARRVDPPLATHGMRIGFFMANPSGPTNPASHHPAISSTIKLPRS